VIVARRLVFRGVPAPAELGTSYEFLVSTLADGTIDLPTAEVRSGEPEHVAASRALDGIKVPTRTEGIKVSTWTNFLDPVYTAHVPRGSLCRVYLARAYATSHGDLLQWRSWPLGDHVPAMSGFYGALRDVWPLVIRAPRSPATSEICVCVRLGALEYIKMQQQIREKIPNVDTSMAEYLRRGMTDDERLVEQWLRKGEDLAALAQSSKADVEKRIVLDAEEIPDTEDGLDAGSEDGFDPTSDGDASSRSTDVRSEDAMTAIEDEDVE